MALSGIYKGLKLSYLITISDDTHRVSVEDEGKCVKLNVDENIFQVDIEPLNDQHSFSLLVNGQSYIATATRHGSDYEIIINGISYVVDVQEEKLALLRDQVKSPLQAGGEKIIAPMPGRVIAIHVAVGDHIDTSQGIVTIEAMKMENELRSQRTGTVSEIRIKEGDTVDKNSVLVVIKD